MEEKHSARKASVLEAARSLGVSTKTIQRYLAKGVLTRIREGGRTYVLVSDLQSLKGQAQSGQGVAAPFSPARELEAPLKNTVILDRGHYDALLTELVQLRKEREKELEHGGILLEIQGKVERTESALRELHQRIESLELGLAALDERMSRDARASAEQEDAGKAPKPPKPWWQK